MSREEPHEGVIERLMYTQRWKRDYVDKAITEKNWPGSKRRNGEEEVVAMIMDGVENGERGLRYILRTVYPPDGPCMNMEK